MKVFHRKLFHILACTPFVVLNFFMDDVIERRIYLIIALVLIEFFLIFDLARFHSDWFSRTLWARFPHMFKEGEERNLIASVWGPVDYLLFVLFFSKPTIIFAFFIGCYCDPIASMVGMKYGGKKNYLGKTWAGTLAFFVAATVFLVTVDAFIHSGVPLWGLVGLSAVATLAERYIPFLDDNFATPMMFAVVMEGALMWVV